jgi:hypothetical protein
MTYTKEQQRKNRKKWVKALQSGKYTKGVGFLSKDNKFCCLGVACEVGIEAGLRIRKGIDDLNEATSYNTKISHLPQNVMDWLGLKTGDGNFFNKRGATQSLVGLNDMRQYPFYKIAQVILEEPPGLVR